MAGIGHVFTISRVAEMLGDEDWLHIENLTELIKIYKADPHALRRYMPSE